MELNHQETLMAVEDLLARRQQRQHRAERTGAGRGGVKAALDHHRPGFNGAQRRQRRPRTGSHSRLTRARQLLLANSEEPLMLAAARPFRYPLHDTGSTSAGSARGFGASSGPSISWGSAVDCSHEAHAGSTTSSFYQCSHVPTIDSSDSPSEGDLDDLSSEDVEVRPHIISL
mmetsp:Transcript_77211/g.213501  ORF Transcript_77211/g.213501 Transcript_77211/m.213501 type:complete len:173 (-) Transcript_77211:272-790(-)